MRPNIFAEILFAVGILLFAFSFIVNGLIIKRLLKIIRKTGIWVFPFMGGIVLIIGTFLHFVKVGFFFPALRAADPGDLFILIVNSLKIGTYESISILAAGVLSLLGGVIYNVWTSH
ncbi:hypothetical protein KAU34_06800 [candidate division WOR-3 bacterium]|nr:hypothetical protein [candidate division WOR-3 bacterium]MCK4576098.1 hypothetical protein [candidate division WOR-3 bacterium]